MNTLALVACGALWVGTGAWLALSPAVKSWVSGFGSRIPATLLPLVGPGALFGSMVLAVLGAVVITRPFGMSEGRLTPVGWVVAAVTGMAFVALQVMGSMVVITKLQPTRETPAGASPSKAQEDEIS